MPVLFVDFQSADFILGIAPAVPPLATFVHQDLLNNNITDPNRHLIGRRVLIIKENHYKAYRGIVKETLQNDFVIVELAANMKRHRVRLSNLTLLYVWQRNFTSIPVNLSPETARVGTPRQPNPWVRVNRQAPATRPISLLPPGP